MKLRVLAFALAILAFFMFVGSPFQQNAKAVALVDDAIVAIIIAALAAWGITFTFTGGYYTVYDWILDMIDESGADFSGINAGVNNLGQLLLNNKFVRELRMLAAYIETRFNLTSNTSVQIMTSGTSVVDELTGVHYQPGIVIDSSTYVEGTELFGYTVRGHDGENYNYYFRFGGIWFRFNLVFSNNYTANVLIHTSEDSEVWSDPHQLEYSTGRYGSQKTMSWQLTEINGEIYAVQVITGTSAVAYAWYKLTGVTSGNDLAIDTGVLSIPSAADVGDLAGVMTLPVPWGTSFWNIINSIPRLTENDKLRDNTDLDLETTEAVEEQIDTDQTEQPFVSDDPHEYAVTGLVNVFPFCIPFDIYNFFECLAADPVAPSFTWRFYVPGICDESIEIDLSAFNTAAQILRTMELLAFCVGLAFVTRKMIRG